MPQPIDMQTEVARVTAAERIQQIADRQSLAAMQRAATAAQDERIEVETQVQQADPKSQQVDRETRRRNPYVGRRRRRKGEPGPEDPEEGSSGSDGTAEEQDAAGDVEGHELDVIV